MKADEEDEAALCNRKCSLQSAPQLCGVSSGDGLQPDDQALLIIHIQNDPNDPTIGSSAERA